MSALGAVSTGLKQLQATSAAPKPAQLAPFEQTVSERMAKVAQQYQLLGQSATEASASAGLLKSRVEQSVTSDATARIAQLAPAIKEPATQASLASRVFANMGAELKTIGRTAAGMATGMLAANAVMSVSARFHDAAEQIDIYGRAVLGVQRISGESAEGASLLVAMFQRFAPSVEVANTRLARFEKNLAGQEDALDVVSNGGKTAASVLEHFGVAVNDASGHLRPTSQILMDLAEGFKNSTDSGAKMLALTVLMGKGSQDMLLMLNQGRGGLEAFAKDAEKYGLILSQDNVNDVASFIKAHKQMDIALQGVALQLGAAFMPAVTAAAAATARFAQLINQTVMPAIHAIPGALPAILIGLGLLSAAFSLRLAVSAGQAAIATAQWAVVSAASTARAIPGLLSSLAMGAAGFMRMAVAAAASATATVAAWLAAAGPIVLIIGAIAIAAGAAVLLLSGKMAEAKDMIGQAFNKIGTAMHTAMDSLGKGMGIGGADAATDFAAGLDSGTDAVETAGTKMAKAAKNAADGELKKFNDAADTRKRDFEVSHVDAETTALQTKLDSNIAEQATLDLKRQIEDLDARSVDYNQKRLELDEQDAITKAKIAESSLKNNQDDLSYQQQLLMADAKAARKRGETVDMHAIRQQIKDMKKEQIQLAPSLLRAEHSVALAERTKGSADLNESLKASNLERQKIALQEQLAPLTAAAVIAKRLSEDAAYQLEIDKQRFGIEEQRFALEKLLLEAKAKEADLQVWMIEHPVGGHTTAATTSPTAPVSLPDSRYHPGEHPPSIGPSPADVTVGNVTIQVNGGQTGDDTLQKIKDSIGAWFKEAVDHANTVDTNSPVSRKLGGAYAGS